MADKESHPAEYEPGVFVFDALPVPGSTHGACRFCGDEITSEDGRFVRVVVVCGAVEHFHWSCFARYVSGLELTRAALAEAPDVIH